MTLLGFERRWARSLLEAFAPPGGAGLAPAEGEVDYVAGFERMHGSFAGRAALGMRAALWIAALSPLWMWRRPWRVTKMPIERRTRLVTELLEHSVYFVRELTFLLKSAASFALLGTASVRARSNYDRGVTPVWPAPALARLPVVHAEPPSDVPPDGVHRPESVPPQPSGAL